jgi:DNA repair protein RecN (Recombination protein N)
MLTTLTVKHFTIVDELMLDFGPGMSVFTGETGAGKSITLDALSLALGAKTDKTVVRTGCQQCDITAVFEVKNNPAVHDWLTAQAIEVDDEVTLRRVINQIGRAKSLINGIPFPLQKVRELGECLINIHGQHQQYHLLHHDNHREQLDAFAMTEKLVGDIAKEYANYQTIQKELHSLSHREDNESRVALLKYQVEELDELNVGEDEFETLNAEYKLLSQQQQFIENTGAMIQRFEGEEPHALLPTIHGILQLAKEIEHPGLKTLTELMNNALIQSEEALAEAYAFQKEVEQNPNRLSELEKRLEVLFNVARKHHVKPAALSLLTQQLHEQLSTFTDSEERIEALSVLKNSSEEKIRKLSDKLHVKRKKEALVLSKQITKTIQSLGMPNGEVDVRVEPQDKISPSGMDKVEYYVCLNKGIAPRPLSKIASGGELSRISLAIQVLTAEKKAYPTLIFDEVDTGIGGAQAAKVGQLLKRLGNHTQVLCVTHQAQVASNGNSHYLVAKKTQKQQTYLSVTHLEGESKINELARMISGVKVTKQTVEHAKELLAQSS